MIAALLLASLAAQDVQIRPAVFDKLIVVRMKNGSDVLAGLEEAVKREGIKNAVILSAIGSVTAYHVHVVDNATLPPKDAYLKESIPMDLGSAQGYVINGRVHCHVVLGDKRKTVAGHLEPGNKVFTFAAITIGILADGANLDGIDDWKR